MCVGRVEGERERERERLQQTPAERGACCRAPSHDPKIMMGAEIKSGMLNKWATQAPLLCYSYLNFYATIL